MKLRFHPGVQNDLNEVLDYYSERSLTAVDRFWDDLHGRLSEIEANPQRFAFLHQLRGLRRARLHRFPYLIVYYEAADGVKVTCVKHEKRHPSFGLSRR
jgi:plasmid stabilization system protein ParE